MKIVIGGAMHKEDIAALAARYFPQAEITIKGDLDAAMMMKNGQADYYLGACDTGAGGSLGMAIALLGAHRCKTLAMPGKIFSQEETAQAVSKGVVAFGFTHQTKETVIKMLAEVLK